MNLRNLRVEAILKSLRYEELNALVDRSAIVIVPYVELSGLQLKLHDV